MFEIENIFYKYKDYIINLFINYYGKEYTDIIHSRISDTYLDFSSNPMDDYLYLEYNEESLKEESKISIINNYNNYNKIKQKIEDKYMEELYIFIKEILNIKEHNIDKDCLLSIFVENEFEESNYIEYIYNNKDQKDNLKRKKELLNILKDIGINNVIISKNIIDMISLKRKSIEKEYRYECLKKTEYGKNILKILIDKYKLSKEGALIYAEAITNINSGAQIIIKEYEKVNLTPYLKIPITRLSNLGIDCLDTTIIHELIHRVETNITNVGISNYKLNKNGVLNEIRTQKLAIELTNKMHNDGIYMYDKKENKELIGECIYEYLFPITYNFISKYEDILKYCSINNDYKYLDLIFGNTLEIYSNYLDNLYNKIDNYSIPNIHMNDYVEKLLKELDDNYKKNIKRKTLK